MVCSKNVDCRIRKIVVHLWWAVVRPYLDQRFHFLGPDTQHSHNFMILFFDQSCPSQRCSSDTELSKHSQGHNRGTEARLQMWIKENKKAQECTIENTVLINRVSSHCTTRTEHMGSARTGGKSQVLAASAQLRRWPA